MTCLCSSVPVATTVLGSRKISNVFVYASSMFTNESSSLVVSVRLSFFPFPSLSYSLRFASSSSLVSAYEDSMFVAIELVGFSDIPMWPVMPPVVVSPGLPVPDFYGTLEVAPGWPYPDCLILTRGLGVTLILVPSSVTTHSSLSWVLVPDVVPFVLLLTVVLIIVGRDILEVGLARLRLVVVGFPRCCIIF